MYAGMHTPSSNPGDKRAIQLALERVPELAGAHTSFSIQGNLV